MLSDQLAHMDEEKRSFGRILTATHKEVQLKALEERATHEHATAIKERLHEANQEITALQDQLRIAEHKLSHKNLAESAEVLKLRDEIALLTHKHRQELEERENHWRMQLLSQREQFGNATTASPTRIRCSDKDPRPSHPNEERRDTGSEETVRYCKGHIRKG